MNKMIFYTLLAVVIAACEPKEVDTIDVRKIWKAETVKENGSIIYNARSTTDTRGGYARFRLNLRQINDVSFTDADGRARTGNWLLTNNYQTLLLQNLTTSARDTSTFLKFDILNKGGDKLILKRTVDGLKSIRNVYEYELIPE